MKLFRKRFYDIGYEIINLDNVLYVTYNLEPNPHIAIYFITGVALKKSGEWEDVINLYKKIQTELL